jgi:hypothetical protein
MPTNSGMQIPPPKAWQEFETICCDLWKKIWDDDDTQKNGRQGQTQSGVDVYGRPGRGKEWAGLQCKGKDSFSNKTVTEEELKKEIEKAKNFEPSLNQFTIVTTAPRDGRFHLS